MSNISLNIHTDRVISWLLWCSLTVLALGLLREAFLFQFGNKTVLKDLRHIALDSENCLGSYYSSVLMIIAAVLMTVIGQNTEGKRQTTQWYLLAVIFTLMSFDESISFHEVMIDPLRPAFSFSSYLHFAWIVPGALFVLTMGLAYLPFVFTLQPRTRNRIILAGALYVTGALGFEAIGGHLILLKGANSTYYMAAFLIEESLEILGLTLFAATLLSEAQNGREPEALDQWFEQKIIQAADIPKAPSAVLAKPEAFDQWFERKIFQGADISPAPSAVLAKKV